MPNGSGRAEPVAGSNRRSPSPSIASAGSATVTGAAVVGSTVSAATPAVGAAEGAGVGGASPRQAASANEAESNKSGRFMRGTMAGRTGDCEAGAWRGSTGLAGAVRGDRFVELGDPLALGRVPGQSLQSARRPQRLALGFERLEVEVGHGGFLMQLRNNEVTRGFETRAAAIRH